MMAELLFLLCDRKGHKLSFLTKSFNRTYRSKRDDKRAAKVELGRLLSKAMAEGNVELDGEKYRITDAGFAFTQDCMALVAQGRA